MKKLALIILIAFLSSSHTATAQMTIQQFNYFISEASESQLVTKNTTLLLDGFYERSIIVADKLLSIQSENANYNYRKGFALYKLNTDFEKAIPFLKKSIQLTTKNYDLISVNEKAAPYEGYYYLGKVYHLLSKIDKAKKYFTLYLDKSPDSKEQVKKAELELQQCDIATSFMKNPKNYDIVNLGDTINSEYADYAPIVSLDGRTLYFTSRRLRADSSNAAIQEPYTNMYYEDVYKSSRNGLHSWNTPKLMPFSLPERNEAAVAVSSDERTIYVYQDNTGNGDIYQTKYSDKLFKNLSPITIKGVNTEAWEPHITSNTNGQYKYFSSDREGGFGGRDIYRITKLPNGQWSKPQNIGPTINTQYDEDSPFMAVDNKTLYFSHNGEKSMGGFDIFVSVVDDEQNWSEPINLGVPLNSTNDDIYYTTTANGLTGYFTSYRPGGFGNKDIYEIKSDYLGIENIAVLTGQVVSSTGASIPGDISFELSCLNCGINNPIEIQLNPSDNSFFANLETCREYAIIFHQNEGKKEFYREKFKTDCKRGFENIIKTILIDSETMAVVSNQEEVIDEEVLAEESSPKKEEVDENDETEESFTPIYMKHYFSYNSNNLSTQEGSLKEALDEMILQAKNGRTAFTITINSSASKVPTRSFSNNMTLAKTRANNTVALIKDFVKKNDILKDKVQISTNKIGVNGIRYNSSYKESKYVPYQYVELKINGTGEDVNIDPADPIYSKDKGLKIKVK